MKCNHFSSSADTSNPSIAKQHHLRHRRTPCPRRQPALAVDPAIVEPRRLSQPPNHSASQSLCLCRSVTTATMPHRHLRRDVAQPAPPRRRTASRAATSHCLLRRNLAPPARTAHRRPPSIQGAGV
nr:hypothetical protein Iba_chr05dCG10730 [Ipomoea batatas]